MLLLGHRGYDAKYPPNTVLAFVKAVEYGADGVELDVWRTKDGKIIVSHDRNIKELAGLEEDWDIKKHTYEEIRKYLVKGKEPFALLEEVYAALPETAFVNVEIKDYDAVEGVLKIIKRFGAENRSIMTSFDVKSLQRARELDPKMKLGLIVGKKRRVLSILSAAYKVRAEYINIPFQIKKGFGRGLTRGILKFYRFFGFHIGVWTPNLKKDMDVYEDIVEMVITDEVEKLLYLKKIDNSKKKR